MYVSRHISLETEQKRNIYCVLIKAKYSPRVVNTAAYLLTGKTINICKYGVKKITSTGVVLKTFQSVELQMIRFTAAGRRLKTVTPKVLNLKTKTSFELRIKLILIHSFRFERQFSTLIYS